MEAREKITGTVFGIQRFSIHDGPGIRTTVFLKGCNARCKWCHNPESLSPRILPALNREKCVSCGACVAACPQGCHRLEGAVHMIDRARCTGCGRCAQVCRTGALEIIGRKMTVEEVFHELIKDQKYYGAQGGVTLSGGEAMLQREFSLALLDRCREAGIHCALECNGLVPFEDFEAFLPRVDLFLLDYKATQAQVHLAYVGCDNARVLDNLRRLHEAGALILLRCPIIPGVNDDHAHLDAIARLTREFPRLVGAEILPYHKLGVAKAERIGSKCVEFEAPDARQVDQWKQYILEQGGRLINVK